MAADNLMSFRAFEIIYTPSWETSRKWITRSRSGVPKSRPRWAAHTRIGIVEKHRNLCSLPSAILFSPFSRGFVNSFQVSQLQVQTS